jgi:dolichol-phosphate mannosyltransferase
MTTIPDGDIHSAPVWPPGRVLVVSATYDERANVPALVAGVLAANPDTQLLIIDDDSPDGTASVALTLAAAEPRLHVLVRKGRRGLGSAIQEGLALARDHGFTVAVNIDADASHDPADIPRLLAALDPLGGPPADVVVGSRRVLGGRTEGWSLIRHLTSRLVGLFTRRLLGVPVRDPSSGYRAIRLAVLAADGTRLQPQDAAAGDAKQPQPFPRPTTSGYAFHEELLWLVHRTGGRIVEIPITFRDRTRGTSKAGLAEISRAVFDLLTLARRTLIGV